MTKLRIEYRLTIDTEMPPGIERGTQAYHQFLINEIEGRIAKLGVRNPSAVTRPPDGRWSWSAVSGYLMRERRVQ